MTEEKKCIPMFDGVDLESVTFEELSPECQQWCQERLSFALLVGSGNCMTRLCELPDALQAKVIAACARDESLDAIRIALKDAEHKAFRAGQKDSAAEDGDETDKPHKRRSRKHS